MAETTQPTASTSDAIKLNVRAPGDKKLTVSISPSASVLQLKEAIAADDLYKDDACPPDTQRLIFSGRVLKDEEKLSTYKIAENHVLHLVRSAKKSEPPPAAAQVPANLNAGQQFANNPLAPLMNASNPGLGGFNPFANMGINQNDPNFLQNMMQSDDVRQQMNRMMDDPAVLDQIIQASPELRAMGPQVRQIMQSPMFRQMMANPEMMRAAAEMQGRDPSAMFGGMGGAGRGGQGGNAQPGLFGLAQQQQNQQRQEAMGGGLGALGGAGAEGQQAGAGAGGMAGMEGLFGPNSPFGMMGGQGMGGQGMGNLGNMFGGMGGQGGFGSNPPPQPADGRSPEERYETQLQSLRDMGFTNATQNVRALIATGGNVEGAVEYILGGGGM